MGHPGYPTILSQVEIGTEILPTEESALFRRPIADSDWQKEIRMLQETLSCLDSQRVAGLKDLVGERIQWLDGHMTRYCELTCPSCDDPCCNGREVFYNRTDLIVLSLSRALPPGQTRERDGEACRYLSRNGCRLPRAERPYVCVWYLCAPQMDLLSEESPFFQRSFVRVLGEVRALRLKLEALYQHHRRGA